MREKKALPLGSVGGGLAFSVTVVIYIFISFIVSLIIDASGIRGTDGAKYIGYLVSPAAIAATAAIAFAYARQPVRGTLPLKTKPKYFIIGLLLIFGLLFSLSRANDGLVSLFETMGYERREDTLPDVSGWKLLPAILVIAVLPAIAEEALFRGLILNNAENGAGTVRSVFLVGLCFSLYHGSVEQTVYQFICGCLFALLAVRARSVAPSVVIHFINNALILVLYSFGAVDGATGVLLIPLAGEIVLYVLSGLSLVGATVWLILDKTEIKACEKGGVKNFFIAASVGLIAMTLVWILGLIK